MDAPSVSTDSSGFFFALLQIVWATRPDEAEFGQQKKGHPPFEMSDDQGPASARGAGPSGRLGAGEHLMDDGQGRLIGSSRGGFGVKCRTTKVPPVREAPGLRGD
jgi:hypothetical protein